MSVATSASIHTVTAFSSISTRVLSFMNAPPPVAMTLARPSNNLAITRRSPSRKWSSPKRSNISGMVSPAAISISASASTKSSFSRDANRRPMVDFPTPMRPISAIGRSNRRSKREYGCSMTRGLYTGRLLGAKGTQLRCYGRHYVKIDQSSSGYCCHIWSPLSPAKPGRRTGSCAR